MAYNFIITATPPAPIEIVDVPEELAKDLADIAKLPRDRQASIDFTTAEEVATFVAQVKSYAVQNGLNYARRNPTATAKISDMPLRVAFRLYKPRASKTPGDSTPPPDTAAAS